MGQNKTLLRHSGQWGLWESELVEYGKVFGAVELFEYRHSDWKRFAEASILPFVGKERFKSCSVLKAVHLTGAVPCLIAELLYKIPYVLSYGYRYDQFAKIDRKWPQWVLTKLLTPITIRFASAVMVPTSELKEYVQTYGAGSVEVIPNGVDLGMFKGPALHPPGRALSNSKGLIILFVGRLEKQKNLEVLIKAMRKLQMFKGPALHPPGRALTSKLLFVGNGSLKQELVKLAKRLNVHLEIKSPMTNDTLPEVYRQADIFVLPSLVEGHPKALLEAMSCGLPCLASDISGIREIINDGVNGLLVEPTPAGLAEGLERLIRDVNLRRRLGSEARKGVKQRFDKRKLMKKETKFILKVIASEPIRGVSVAI